MSVATDRAKAVAHPLRVRILDFLVAEYPGKASPSSLAVEFDEPLGNVSYHVKTLLDYGMIEEAGTEPRRGAVEHYYRANGISDQAALDRITRVLALLDSGDRDIDEALPELVEFVKATGREL